MRAGIGAGLLGVEESVVDEVDDFPMRRMKEGRESGERLSKGDLWPGKGTDQLIILQKVQAEGDGLLDGGVRNDL